MGCKMALFTEINHLHARKPRKLPQFGTGLTYVARVYALPYQPMSRTE